MLELIIDNREKNAQDVYRTMSSLIDDKSSVKIDVLSIGDYQISYNNDVILVIERKTIADYAASIKDGRHREQKGRLLGQYQKNKILYLIEGDLTQNNNSYRYNNVSKDTIISAIFNTILRDEIQVFHTSNNNETIEIIMSLYKKLKKNGISFIEEKKDNYEDNLLDTIKETKGGNMTPEISFRMMLNSIPTVSNKISQRIVKYHKNMNDFIKYLENIEDKIKYIGGLKLEEGDRAIPKKTCEIILEYIGIK
jgi:ERCC4-type nuclease